ncbi:MAG: hypothetical protein MUC87_09665 [Bacteroidia bacterium]|nr:hypothetical protein [Bacteroidia bacterium]
MREISIETIRKLPSISPHLLNTWADACAILLEVREHLSPKAITVSGCFNEKLNLSWDIVKIKMGYEDMEQTAEFAGYGAALLIIDSFTNLKAIQRRAKGDGVDIVLAESSIADEENFLSEPTTCAFIEAKGTRNKKDAQQRLKEGIKQSEKARKTAEVYVISTEFESPAVLTDFRSKI